MQEVGLGYSRFWLGTFVAEAARRGAAAMVVIHPRPGRTGCRWRPAGDLERRFLAEQIPVVCVSGIDGAALMHAIGAGQAQAKLVVVSEMKDVESSNVSGVARLQMAGRGAVVLAHRDHGIHPGANERQRLRDDDRGRDRDGRLATARSIEFLCTTAEEDDARRAGAIESRRAEGTLGDLRAAIDLDMFGVGGRLKLVELGLWPDTLRTYPAHRMAHARARGGRRRARLRRGPDDGSVGVAESGRFIQAGVPAVWFWKPDDFYYHSVHDTIDNLDGNSLKAVADITAIALSRMANDDELPREP